MGGQRLRIADLTILGLEAFCTKSLREQIKAVYVEVNGYRLFLLTANAVGPANALGWPEGLNYDASSKEWVNLVKKANRNLLFDPPVRETRFLPLQHIEPVG
jgi:hypothetical protein